MPVLKAGFKFYLRLRYVLVTVDCFEGPLLHKQHVMCV